jgi:carbonic anhydrase
MILDLGLPSLVPEWRKMFSSTTMLADVAAGLTVGCIAVPLSLAIAVASGLPPEVGLVSAATAGLVGAMMGGTTLAITGPANAIILLIGEAVHTHGIAALPIITCAAGGLQLLTGMARGGKVTKFVPWSVISGFTTGIGLMILTGQLPKALGLAVPGGLKPLEILTAMSDRLADINLGAAALAAGTAAAMLTLPKLHPKIPSALVAVAGATAATRLFDLDVATVGALPAASDAFHLSALALPPIEALPSLTSTILLIYAMTSIESLLSCSAIDKMRPTTYKHCPDQVSTHTHPLAFSPPALN